tara:strand:+ start:522 stop:1475 length:954 start_codon:yes stop_codon:yes gene_type:complete
MEKSTLQETAVKVRLHAKFWSGIKADKVLRGDLAENVNARENYLHVSKHLLGRNCNKYFRRILDKIRHEHYYPMTVPFLDNSTDDYTGKVVSGWRLCPSQKLDELQSAMDECKRKFEQEVETFCKEYPKNINEAKSKLGKAFNECDYPNVEDVREKFVFDFEISLLGNEEGSELIRGVSDSMKKRIKQQAENNIKNNVKNIMITTVDALVEQVDHIADKLKSYDPKNKQKSGSFHTSSFDKLRTAVDMLPAINEDMLGNDPTVKQAHQSLVSVLAKINSVDNLRDDSELGSSKRESVAKGLSKAIDPLKDELFGGGK